MKDEKVRALAERLKDSLGDARGKLKETLAGQPKIPAAASSALSVTMAAGTGYVDGMIGGKDNKHTVTLVTIGGGAVMGIGGAITGNPTIAQVGLDVVTGPACGLAYGWAYEAGTEAKLARMDAAAKAAASAATKGA